MAFNYRDFYNKLSYSYNEESFVYKTPSGKVRQKFVKTLIDNYALEPFLDVGCGGGEYLEYFQGFSMGIDLAEGGLIRARLRVPDSLLCVGSAEKLSFINSEFFNTVLCSEVVEHIEDPDSFFVEAYRILKENGKLLVTCPNYTKAKPGKVPTGVLKEYGIDEDEYLHTAYKPEELEEMAIRVGFSVIEKGTFEKEMRYWRRPIAEVFNFVEKITGSKLRIKCENVVRNIAFFCLKISGIISIISRSVDVGIRSYIVLEKKTIRK